MKSIYYAVYALAFWVIWSGCTNDGSSSNGTSKGNEPITHTLDTTVGYCFQLSQNGIEEVLELVIKGNKIGGSGTRIYLGTQQVYYLTVGGVFDGNTVDVTIQATNERDAKKSFVHAEIWTFEEERLQIKNRKIKKLEGDFELHRIYCQSHPNSDSTRYNTIGEFNEGYAVVSKNGKYGVINEKGEITIPLSFRDIGIVREGSIVFYDEHIGLRGLLDINGNVLVEPKYVEMMAFDNGLAAFMTDEGKWGFLDRELNVAIKPKYKNINFFKPDYTRAAFNEGLANVQNMDETWNYINNKGEIVIAGEFIFANAFENGQARVFKNNKWYVINKAGKCIDNCD